MTPCRRGSRCDRHAHAVPRDARRWRNGSPFVLRAARRIHLRHGARQVHVRDRQQPHDRAHDPTPLLSCARGRSRRQDPAREALKAHAIRDTFEDASIADLPAGTGLGSSSCYLVGLLNALHHDRRDYVPLQTLAEEACHIELDILRQPIGKQDQYMATYGGLTVLEIASDGKVAVRQLRPSSSDIADFVAHTHIYYTGAQRDAREVLRDQNVAMQKKESTDHDRVSDSLNRIKDLGYRILESIESSNFDRWGEMLDEH